MIRVLPYDHHLYFAERRFIKRIKDELARRIYDLARLLLLLQKMHDLPEVRFFKLLPQFFFPTGFYVYVHGGFARDKFMEENSNYGQCG